MHLEQKRVLMLSAPHTLWGLGGWEWSISSFRVQIWHKITHSGNLITWHSLSLGTMKPS